MARGLDLDVASSGEFNEAQPSTVLGFICHDRLDDRVPQVRIDVVFQLHRLAIPITVELSSLEPVQTNDHRTTMAVLHYHLVDFFRNTPVQILLSLDHFFLSNRSRETCS